MATPAQSVTLTPEQILELSKHLSGMRHNVNNNLALIIAATELIQRKPESAARLLENIADQPKRIIDEMQKFSREFELAMGTHRG